MFMRINGMGCLSGLEASLGAENHSVLVAIRATCGATLVNTNICALVGYTILTDVNWQCKEKKVIGIRIVGRYSQVDE